MKLQLLAVAMLACGAQAQVFSDDFTAYGTGLNFAVLATPIIGDGAWRANWTVVPGAIPYQGQPYTGQVDILGAGFYANTICRDAGGVDPCVDLVGSAFPAGARLQSRGIAITQPWIYALTFDLAGSQRFNQNIVTVGVSDGVNDLVSAQYVLNSGDPFTRRTLLFWVFNPATIRIYFDNSSNLDAVNVCKGGYYCGFMGALLRYVSLAPYSFGGR